MLIEIESNGGIVVRWVEHDAWLLFAPGQAHWVMRGSVLGRVVVGVA